MSTLGVIEAELRGTLRALATLSSLPCPPGTTIAAAEGGASLRTDIFADRPETHFAAAYMEVLVRSLNGLAMAYDAEHEPVSLGEVRHGSHITYAWVSALVNLRRPYSFTERAKTLPPPSTNQVRAAVLSPDCREALGIWFGQRDWVSLYKIFEIVRGAGREQELADEAGIPIQELHDFTESANNRGFTGDAARHARVRTLHQEAKPMTLPDAADLIRVVLWAWLEGVGLRSAEGGPVK